MKQKRSYKKPSFYVISSAMDGDKISIDVLIRQVISQKQKKLKTSINQGFQRCLLASQTGIEPATFRLGVDPIR